MADKTEAQKLQHRYSSALRSVHASRAQMQIALNSFPVAMNGAQKFILDEWYKETLKNIKKEFLRQRAELGITTPLRKKVKP